jgi:hypothetical protein
MENKIERPAVGESVTQAKMFNVMIPITQLEEYLLETVPFHKVNFDDYADEEGNVHIEYKYGDCKDDQMLLVWSAIGYKCDDSKFYRTYYGVSSPLDIWWKGLTEKVEDNEELFCSRRCGEDGCPECQSDVDEEWCEKHEQVMWKNAMKCGACLDDEEEEARYQEHKTLYNEDEQVILEKLFLTVACH